jgi:hypothetical protein
LLGLVESEDGSRHADSILGHLHTGIRLRRTLNLAQQFQSAGTLATGRIQMAPHGRASCGVNLRAQELQPLNCVVMLHVRIELAFFTPARTEASDC